MPSLALALRSVQLLPGVRENGGHYAHAAVWAMTAQALHGDTAATWKSWRGLNPAHRAAHPEHGPRYELEPYVMAGDILSAAPYVSRGGWSWYTGSAGWMHRAALETLLGLNVHGDRLCLTPRVPAGWPGFSLDLQLGGRVVHLCYGALRTEDGAPVRHLAPSEWVDWRQTLPGTVFHLEASRSHAP